MAESRSNFDVSTVADGRCFAQWREGVPCPNAWEFVIENIMAAGYMKCCGLHEDGYRRFNPLGEGVTWRAWTRADWEASGRGALHEAQDHETGTHRVAP